MQQRQDMLSSCSHKAFYEQGGVKESIGTGDVRIQIIPSLSSATVKNGQRIVLSAIVTARAGVDRVYAELGGVDNVELHPVGIQGDSLPSDGTAIFQADWIAHDLEERVYQITLHVIDREGNTLLDQSLHFSDPAAGYTEIGTPNYPTNMFKRIGGLNLRGSCGVIDAVNGYAYIGHGCQGCESNVVTKVALGNDGHLARIIGSVTISHLVDESDYFTSVVIDQNNGYAYFGTHSNKVVKMALGDGDSLPTKVGECTLSIFNSDIAVIDEAGGYAYFGSTGSIPGEITKVRLGNGSDPPFEVPNGRLVLESTLGEYNLSTGFIDPPYTYFVAQPDNSSAKIVKIYLGIGDNPPERVGGPNHLTLNNNENDIRCCAYDEQLGYAYLGTHTAPGVVIKVKTNVAGAPTRVGAVTLNTFENNLESAVVDPVAGFAYFGNGGTTPGLVVKVALGSGDNPPSRIGRISLAPKEYNLNIGLIDIKNGFAYFGSHGYIINGSEGYGLAKVALGTSNLPPTRLGSLFLAAGEDSVSCGVIDAVNGYAYFGTDTYPGKVVKVALGNGCTYPTRVGTLTLSSGEGYLQSAVIDVNSGFAYFGTNTGPGKVVKVALENGNSPPTRVGVAEFTSSESGVDKAAVIDTAAGYAYFSTRTLPAKVIKVGLGSGRIPPTRVGALTLNSGEGYLQSAVIDSGNGYAYFGTAASVVKMALGSGINPPTRIGSVTLNAGENSLSCAVIDTTIGCAYFGTFTVPGIVVKVALGSGMNLPTRLGAVRLNQSNNENGLKCAVIDIADGYAYFGAVSGRVVKIKLGDSAELPVSVGSLALSSGEEDLSCGVMDTDSGYAYFGTQTEPGRVVKVDTQRLLFDSQKDYIKGTKLVMPESGEVNDMRFYAHAQEGNVCMAIYDNASPRNLLWQSGSMIVSITEGWITVPISTGTPPSLSLSPGNYWLTYQVDSTQGVASYNEGQYGDGFFIARSYDSFPTSIDLEDCRFSTEMWSQYITYDISMIPTPTNTATDTSTPTWTLTSTPSPTPTETTPTSTSTPTETVSTPTPTPTSIEFSPPVMVSVAAGTFTMGRRSDGDDLSGQSNEDPGHSVTLSSYSIGKYEITNKEYADILNWVKSQGYITGYSGDDLIYNNYTLLNISSPSCQIKYIGNMFSVTSRDGYSMESHPVVMVSWYGAVAYCHWLSLRQGLVSCYNFSEWTLSDPFSGGYRLPSEAEWERAAAWDGTKHWIYGFQSDVNNTGRSNYRPSDFANPLSLTSYPYTAPVGWYDGIHVSPSGNIQTTDGQSPVGCYDMSGNVFEWCNDSPSDYTGESQVDPFGPDSGSTRIRRGGSWADNAIDCRTARRYTGDSPSTTDYVVGFRIVKSEQNHMTFTPTPTEQAAEVHHWESY